DHVIMAIVGPRQVRLRAAPHRANVLHGLDRHGKKRTGMGFSAPLWQAGNMAPERVGWLAFDMDGVLVDVRASFRVATELTVAALGGGPVRSREITDLKHAGGFNNDWDVTRELLRRRGIAVSRARVIAAFNRFYLGEPGRDGLILNEKWLLPRPGLMRLRQRFRLAIFTGRPRADALFTLRLFHLESLFDLVLGLEDTRPKPHPDGLLQLQ